MFYISNNINLKNSDLNKYFIQQGAEKYKVSRNILMAPYLFSLLCREPERSKTQKVWSRIFLTFSKPKNYILSIWYQCNDCLFERKKSNCMLHETKFLSLLILHIIYEAIKIINKKWSKMQKIFFQMRNWNFIQFSFINLTTISMNFFF